MATSVDDDTPRGAVERQMQLAAEQDAVEVAGRHLVGGRPAELRIGDSLLMVTEAGERDLFPAVLYIYVDDADTAYERAIAAGASTIEAPTDTPYGDRGAMVLDPFGNMFQIAHRLDRP